MYAKFLRPNRKPACPHCKAMLEFELSCNMGNTAIYTCLSCGFKFEGNYNTDTIVRYIANPPLMRPPFNREAIQNPLPKDKPVVINTGKARIDLVPPVAIYSMAESLTYGADKHGENNWREKRINIVKRTGSALRHILKFLAGHDIDEESGVHHLGCAMGSLAVVLESLKIHSGIDNRCPMPDHKLTDTFQQ